MDVLTLARAKELAQEVVNEFGEDYVYPESHKRQFPNQDQATCVYVHEGKPSCLVGQILHRHGVSLEELALRENIGGFSVTEATTETEDYVSSFMSNMQWRQDEGWTWGEALAEASVRYPG